MVIGATTDYGALHPALKRRFGEPFMMRPLPYETLVQLALGLVPSLTLPGAYALADRCKVSGAPHELKTLCEQVSMWARATKATVVDAPDVVQVLNNLGIDAQGLRPIDRKVLEVMQNMPRRRVRDREIVGYGGSEADVCNLAGIDRVEFQKVVRPRLMSRGLIHVRAGIGLALTSQSS
jgi:Holliday junction resolvasome RuvABC ATP-dependent DNA helicase subunit